VCVCMLLGEGVMWVGGWLSGCGCGCQTNAQHVFTHKEMHLPILSYTKTSTATYTHTHTHTLTTGQPLPPGQLVHPSQSSQLQLLPPRQQQLQQQQHHQLQHPQQQQRHQQQQQQPIMPARASSADIFATQPSSPFVAPAAARQVVSASKSLASLDPNAPPLTVG
jgi:hypothetical protein